MSSSAKARRLLTQYATSRAAAAHRQAGETGKAAAQDALALDDGLFPPPDTLF